MFKPCLSGWLTNVTREHFIEAISRQSKESLSGNRTGKLQTNDAGLYVVTVANEFGNVTSTPATLTVNTEGVAINLYSGVTIVGEVGKSYQIRYTTNLSQPTWVPL